ncbi:MAG: sensor domain-containing diguanylate cyclase, partial [Sulfitobacter sp.]
YPKDGETSEDLMKKADQAMYEVKRSGKNNFKFAKKVT